MDTLTNGPFSYIAVPCTRDDNVDHEFFLTATLLDEHGSRIAMSIQRVSSFKGFNFSAKVHGMWVQGQSAMGHVATFNEWSALNPCWMMRILGTDMPSEMRKNQYYENKNNACAAESKLNTVSTSSVFKRPHPVTPSKDDEQAGSGGEDDNISALEMSPDMLEGVHNSVVLPSQLKLDEEVKDDRSEADDSSKRGKEGSVIGAASVASQLTYDNMNEPNMQSRISVASNDTGPYSVTRLRKKDSKPTVRHFNICTLLSPSVTRDFGENGSRPNSTQNSRAGSPAPYGEADAAAGGDTTYLRQRYVHPDA